MSEDGQLVIGSNDLLRAESSRGELEEKLMRLFGVGGHYPSAESLHWSRAAQIAQDFLRSTAVSTGISLQALTERFKQSRIPTEPSDMDSYLDYLGNDVIAHSIHTSSPRFIGHMTSALPCFTTALNSLITATNQNVVKSETAKTSTLVERQSLAMIHRLVYGYSDDFYDRHIQQRDSTLGILVSGGTLANITALWCARNSSLKPEGSFAGIENDGVSAALEHYGYNGMVIIGSSLMHYSLAKAVDLLGIGAQGLIKIPVDDRGKVDLDALRLAISDCSARRLHILAIVGIAGTTESGAIDPLVEMAQMAREAGTHFHVDAAWAGPVLFSEHHRRKLAGVEQADSVTIDAHKQMYLPMGIGMLLLRDPHMARCIEKQARYVLRAGSTDLGKRSLEGSRPAMALFLHAGLHMIGSKGYEFLIDEGISKARFAADLIDAREEFELLAEPEINIILYRYIPGPLKERAAAGELSDSDNQTINDFNRRLQKAQREAGRTFVSRTEVEISRHGRRLTTVALRAVIANPHTTHRDIVAVLNDQVRIAAEMSASETIR